MNNLEQLIYDSLLFDEKAGDKKTAHIRRAIKNNRRMFAYWVAVSVQKEARKLGLALESEELAEEVVHEVMLAVINNIKKLQAMEMEEIKGFIYLATRNISHDIFRKEKRREAENIDDLQLPMQAVGDPQDSLGEQVILDCIAAMPPIYRDILELTVYYGLSLQECAKLLKISQAAARKRLERARAIVRAKLEEGEEQYV